MIVYTSSFISLHILEYKSNIKNVNSFYTDRRFYIKFCFFFLKNVSCLNSTTQTPNGTCDCVTDIHPISLDKALH